MLIAPTSIHFERFTVGQVFRGVCVRGKGEGGVVPPKEGGCLTGVFESLIICSLWNRVVKLMG